MIAWKQKINSNCFFFSRPPKLQAGAPWLLPLTTCFSLHFPYGKSFLVPHLKLSLVSVLAVALECFTQRFQFPFSLGHLPFSGLRVPVPSLLLVGGCRSTQTSSGNQLPTEASPLLLLLKSKGGVPLGREQAPKGEWQVQGAKGRPKEGMLKQAVGIISGVSLEPQLSLLMANIISILQM